MKRNADFQLHISGEEDVDVETGSATLTTTQQDEQRWWG